MRREWTAAVSDDDDDDDDDDDRAPLSVGYIYYIRTETDSTDCRRRDNRPIYLLQQAVSAGIIIIIIIITQTTNKRHDLKESHTIIDLK